MNSWGRFFSGFFLCGFVVLALIVGCTRQISVPVSPTLPSTPTLAATNSPTITNTFTSTISPTPTNSSTPTVTNTIGSPTATPTITDTPTDTLSPTVTFTPTNSPTFTPSPTPTVDPNLIADFEEGGTSDVTGSSLGLTGSWYEVGSTGTSPAPPAALTPTTSGGCGSNNYAEATGTTGSTAPVFAALQGDFASTSGTPVPYNISTQAPLGTNAFVFCIKGSAPGGQVFFAVSDASTTETSDNAGMMVPITGSWQPVTVCFNHMQSQGFGVTTVGHMFDPTTAISFSWKVTASGQPFDIGIDNFAFTIASGGSCPAFTATPTPNPFIIDDVEDGNNQIKVQNGRNGYWFSYTAPPAETSNMIFTAPGYASTNAVECSGTLAAAASSAGYGFSFTDPATAPNVGVSFYDATVGGSYTGISFYAKAASIPVTNCTGTQAVLVDLVDSAMVDHNVAIPLTTSWQQFTIYFNQALSSTGANLDPTQMYQIKWEPQGNGANNYSYDFLVDSVQFVTGGPSPATPIPTNVVDDFSNGSGKTMWGANPGYWFTYGDATTAPTMCPSGISNTIFYLSSPGHAGAGTPTFAAHISGNRTSYCGMGFWLNGNNTYNSDISAYTQLVFYAKSSDSAKYVFAANDNTTQGCYPPSLSNQFTGTAGWAPVTVTFSALNPATANASACPSPGAYTAHALDRTTVGQFQWQINANGVFDLWVDDIFLQ